MKNKLQILFFVIAVLLASCVDKYDPKLVGETSLLTVDGGITNADGPYEIAISYSAGYNSKESVYDKQTNGTTIYIIDNLGNRENLNQAGNGRFLTRTEFKGVVGRTYTLNIQTPDGKKYASTPETMKAVSQIDKIYGEYEPLLTTPRPIIGQFNVFLDTKDPVETEDYYRWTWTHYYIPNFSRIYTVPGTDPPQRFTVKYCKPASCWHFESCKGCILLANDKFVNGNKIAHLKIATVPYDDITPYYFLIEQKAITKQEYDYWKIIKDQTSNSGGVFDVPPASAKGNISNISDKNEVILGYFGASGVNKIGYSLPRIGLKVQPYEPAVPAFPDYKSCDECTSSYYRTPVKPLNWVY
jgi:Domain of unknown function (DUF4249)